jgi:hypothetical protein
MGTEVGVHGERLLSMATASGLSERSLRRAIARIPPRLLTDALKKIPPQERLKGLPARERLKGLPAQERVKGLSEGELLLGLSSDVLRQLPKELIGKQPARIRSQLRRKLGKRSRKS